MALTTTIRVAITDRDAAQELAKQTGQSPMDVVHAALEVYRRQLLLASIDQGFAALRRDPAAWEEGMAERQGMGHRRWECRQSRLTSSEP